MDNEKLPRVSIVLGTRPEAIKFCPLILEFKKIKQVNIRVILTGQHKEMVQKIMDIFKVEPDIDMQIMRKGQDLVNISLSVMRSLKQDFLEYPPKLVLVQGDTSTAFTAALTAFYLKIPVGHVEAGLRTNNLYNPFPEEGNRRLISQIASLHFAPTNLSKENLLKSGVTGQIFVTGNTVIDSLLIRSKLMNTTDINREYINNQNILLLATVHRRENWGENIVNISKGIKMILDNHTDVAFVIPMHPNEKVRNSIKSILSDYSRVFLVEPLEYDDMILVLKKTKFVLTDSGGLQEESPSLGKPVLVLRETTERPEGIDSGTAKLIGTDPQKIYQEANLLLTNDSIYNQMSKAINPYGDGCASERIANACLEYCCYLY